MLEQHTQAMGTSFQEKASKLRYCNLASRAPYHQPHHSLVTTATMMRKMNTGQQTYWSLPMKTFKIWKWLKWEYPCYWLASTKIGAYCLNSLFSSHSISIEVLALSNSYQGHKTQSSWHLKLKKLKIKQLPVSTIHHVCMHVFSVIQMYAHYPCYIL